MKYNEDKLMVSCDKPNTEKPLSSDAVLAEVRALRRIISSEHDDMLFDFGYNHAIDVVLKILSEHFR